ncbi:protease [Flavobacterium akiainvivens]|uniref:Protease n=1 Tax=Flavobacterium akiainvivens TaxID=1202724 RepID=A0A0M8MGM7_9FLAO|nr:rhomboid family intramembrane serine protease [Flavobacterium akiainvivens]KOS05188.1 protease [Flavobacterium akiainvivens]SFQ50769.1 Rhomboid family protein [Flavobacterium akiainvivens]
MATDIYSIVLFILIGINVLVSYKGFNDQLFFRKYDFHIGSIRAGEQYRMFTSAFLHADIMHLIFNMLTLYFFAPVVMVLMGIPSFIAVYALSLLAGNLLTFAFHKNDYWYRAIGASGAVTGVLYASILLEPNMELGLYFVIPVPAYLFGIGYLLYSIYGMKAKNDNIGHVAHFGGAIGGFAFTLIKRPDMFYNNTLMVILLAIPIVILFVLARMKKL